MPGSPDQTKTSPSILVRNAEPRDGKRLADLSSQLGYPVEPRRMAERLKTINGDGNRAALVAQVEGQVVGWAELWVRTTLVSDRAAELEGLVVDEDFRDRGIGRELMRHAEEWARGHGCLALVLRSNVLREAAHRFYTGLGYSQVKLQKAFRKDLS